MHERAASESSPVALVVGAGDFIGTAIARRFAAGGYTAALGVRERIQASGRDLGALAADTLMNPASVGEAYWMLHQQSRDAWTFELDLRPHREAW